MNISKEMIRQAMEVKSTTSDSFKLLPFYEDLMKLINDEYSNDEIQTVAWIFEEVARNIKYDIIRKRLSHETKIIVELKNIDRKNNIYVDLRIYGYLLLENGERKYCDFQRNYEYTGKYFPFYKGKYETVKEIFDEIDMIAEKFQVTNKDEVIKKIEELTNCKRNQK